MNLYELATNYQELLDLLETVDTNNEEYSEAMLNTLESLDDAIDDKAEGIVHVLQSLKYSEGIVEEEIKRLQAKKKALANNQRSLKDYLTDTMKYVGKEKIKTPKFSVWIQNNPPSLRVTDEERIPKSFYIDQAPKLDKRSILSHIKETGEIIPGTEVTQTEGVRFR